MFIAPSDSVLFSAVINKRALSHTLLSRATWYDRRFCKFFHSAHAVNRPYDCCMSPLTDCLIIDSFTDARQPPLSSLLHMPKGAVRLVFIPGPQYWPRAPHGENIECCLSDNICLHVLQSGCFMPYCLLYNVAL